MSPTPSPAPTPTLTPAVPLINIDAPLITVDGDGATAIISVLALIVSGISVWYSVSARPRINVGVIRQFLEWEGRIEPDGDDVVITNTGRSAGIIYGVTAINANGARLTSARMPRGYDSTLVDFPDFPVSIPPGGVFKVWFNSGITGDNQAGVTHGFEISYEGRAWKRWFFRKGKVKKIVKAPAEPPAVTAVRRRDAPASDSDVSSNP